MKCKVQKFTSGEDPLCRDLRSALRRRPEFNSQWHRADLCCLAVRMVQVGPGLLFVLLVPSPQSLLKPQVVLYCQLLLYGPCGPALRGLLSDQADLKRSTHDTFRSELSMGPFRETQPNPIQLTMELTVWQ